MKKGRDNQCASTFYTNNSKKDYCMLFSIICCVFAFKY